MLFSLILRLCGVSFYLCMCMYMRMCLIAAEPDLKTIVAQAEQAAHDQKQEVLAMENEIKTAFVKKNAGTTGSCKVGGCAALKGEPAIRAHLSPLMESRKPIIFVSASMPKESLKRLAYQAVQNGAALVIRGMVNGSMVETAKLVDEIDHPLDIDPKLFQQFKIIKVPVFMVYRDQTWHKVAGNVELNFAIEMAGNKKVPS